MKIGIMGGSFDPIHNGHIELALNVKKTFKLDKIMFLPLGDPPHKKLKADKELRIKMLEAAIKGEKDCFVSRIEMDRTGKTYTFDTITWLKQNTEDDYFYIIGGDTVNKLHTWYRAEELFKIVEFILVDRANVDESEAVKRVEQLGARLHIANHTGLDVSSTMVRDRVKEGKNITGLVPESVMELIEEYGIYKN